MSIPSEVVKKEAVAVGWVRQWRGLIFGALLVMAGLALLMTTLATLNNTDATEAVRRNGLQSACRAEKRVPLDTAMADLATAQGDLLSLATSAQGANYTGQTTDMLVVVASMPTARAHLAAASSNVQTAIAAYVTAFDECLAR